MCLAPKLQNAIVGTCPCSDSKQNVTGDFGSKQNTLTAQHEDFAYIFDTTRQFHNFLWERCCKDREGAFAYAFCEHGFAFSSASLFPLCPVRVSKLMRLHPTTFSESAKARDWSTTSAIKRQNFVTGKVQTSGKPRK